MSIGSLGLIGSLAATPLSQKTTEADRALREAADSDRQTESAQQAATAAGIGQMEEDSEAHDRDADGRQPWERFSAKHGAGDVQSGQVKGADSGETGGELDLVG